MGEYKMIKRMVYRTRIEESRGFLMEMAKMTLLQMTTLYRQIKREPKGDASSLHIYDQAFI